LYLRPLKTPNPHYLAGIMASAFTSRSGVLREHLAMVAVKNKVNGLHNPRAPHAAKITLSDVLEAEPVVDPLTRYEIAPFTDAAVVAVVASEDAARRLTDTPVWIEGVGWATEAGTGSTAWHDLGSMASMRMAAAMASSQAGVGNIMRDTSFAEVEDRYSFMELLALEEAIVGDAFEASRMLENGDFDRNGYYPVNPSGGSLSMGVAFEATGGLRVLEAYLRLVGGGEELEAGAERAFVASWRGLPTRTSMAVILGL
ncbi:MAG: thiolase domain-containing protein, partial [Desulfurococcales archaeon]|nr:thiolase domain-containing protein [Desulfurococcales archaeon]